MNVAFLIVGILLIVIVGSVLVCLSIYRFERVEQGREVVIFRLGRFLRMAGPGLVPLARRVDTIKFHVDTREKPNYVFVSERFRYVPVDVTFIIWGRTDLRQAARIANVPLQNLATFSESERARQLQLLVLAAARRAMRDAEDSAIEASNPGIGQPESDARIEHYPELGHLQDLLPLLPGLPPSLRLLAALERELADTLPTIGIILRAREGVSIYQVLPPEEIMLNIERDRLIRLLRTMFPNLEQDIVVQALTALEDKAMPQVKRINVGGNAVGQFDMHWDNERYRVYRDVAPPPMQSSESGAEKHAGPESAPDAISSGEPNQDEVLSVDDLTVLKPVPVYQHDRAA